MLNALRHLAAVRGLKLLVYEALSSQCIRPSALNPRHPRYLAAVRNSTGPLLHVSAQHEALVSVSTCVDRVNILFCRLARVSAVE
jgi:hypothetical protein